MAEIFRKGGESGRERQAYARYPEHCDYLAVFRALKSQEFCSRDWRGERKNRINTARTEDSSFLFDTERNCVRYEVTVG